MTDQVIDNDVSQEAEAGEANDAAIDASKTDNAEDAKVAGQEANADNAEQSQEGDKEAVEEKPAIDTESFTMPEGMVLNQDTLQEFLPLAAKHGFNQEQSQELVNVMAAHTQRVIEAERANQADNFQKMQEDRADKWADESAKDKEFGGADFEKNLSRANEFLADVATSEYLEFLKTEGLANHPEMIRQTLRTIDIMQKRTEEAIKSGASVQAKELTRGERIYGPNS